MMFLALTGLAYASPPHVHIHQEIHEHEAEAEAEAVIEEPELPRVRASVEGFALGMPGDLTGGFGARLTTRRNVFLTADVRGQASGDWTGRAVAGFDVLGRWQKFDLTLGLGLGGAGDWRERALYGDLGAGFAFGFAYNRERLHFNYNHLVPFGDNAACLGLAESELRVTYDLGDTVSLFGTGMRRVPNVDLGDRKWALGLGARVTF
ncbi:MAG: hypothetical protein H6739_01660 [Alphaproteobacteria bacterium]|nr:hypothetical protein [Alphaproteobacteria bacterium]